MKYSDQQRVEKIRETTEKLLDYVRTEHITPDVIFEKEPIQWAITTPLYNIGEHAAKLQDCAIGWCITMRIPTGQSSAPSSSTCFRTF